jgi:NAD-dependent DNA ligase
MNTKFKIIVETGQGREIHPAASLAEAITIYREQMEQHPQQQIHLLRDMSMQTASSAPQPSQPKVVRHGQIDRQYNTQLDGAGNPECPLYGKDVRITGTFEQIQMSRDDVAAACQRLGAKSAREGICKSMDIVIIGNNPGPTKQQKIEEWRKEGHDINTISQFDFKEILNKYDNQ